VMAATSTKLRVERLRVAVRSLTSTSFGAGGLAFVIAVTGLNITNFAFHVVISRIIGPGGYGALGALLNVIVVLAIPLSALQAAVSLVVAQRVNAHEAVGLRGLVKWSAVVGTSGSLLCSRWIRGSISSRRFQRCRLSFG
jgi:hypothetical protein